MTAPLMLMCDTDQYLVSQADLKEQLRQSLEQQRDLQTRVDQLEDEAISLDSVCLS